MLNKPTADYYGKISLLGMEVEGYVLSDGTACLSERGAYALLGFSTNSVLNNVFSNNGAKEIKQFISIDLTCSQTVIVKANCHQKNSKIKVYTAKTINAIAKAYATVYLQGKLRQNQVHIGLHCAILRNALADAALENMIFDACSYKPKQSFSQRTEKNYINAVEVVQELGFTCSLPNNVATKQDIAQFLKVPMETLNSFLHKHKEIKPIVLSVQEIRSLHPKAGRMNGYSLDDSVKIILGMDSETGIEVKKRLFGSVGAFAKTSIKGETEWRQSLAKVFHGFDIQYNYPVGAYRVDFFVPNFFGFGLCLECNGYDCHRYYDLEKEKKRQDFLLQQYALVRFHHKIDWQTLVNGILQAKPGKVIVLYDVALV
jgi:very-short-patch-repair endonuclease